MERRLVVIAIAGGDVVVAIVVVVVVLHLQVEDQLDESFDREGQLTGRRLGKRRYLLVDVIQIVKRGRVSAKVALHDAVLVLVADK